MAIEKKRGCGFRKVGGKYMVAGKPNAPCCRLPLELHVCPVCASGIKQARGWTWIQPRKLFQGGPACTGDMDLCPAWNLPERAGLLWIGEAFYPTPEDFMREARELGISKRISAVPREFKLSETYVFLAHPKAIELSATDPRVTDEEKRELIEEMHAAGFEPTCDADLGTVYRPGVITLFKPERIEQLVTETQAQDTEFMTKLEDAHLTPVVVPDNDPDHQGRVHASTEQHPRSNGGDLFEEAT